MIKEATKAIVQEYIQAEHPHLLFPGAIRAEITKATGSGSRCQYSVRVLARDGGYDDNYPEIPGVGAKERYEVGTTVAAVLLYGELTPYILGEVV